MKGSSIPPGCKDSDTPGNRPEDAYWEKVIDEFYASLDPELKAWIDAHPLAPIIIEKALQWGIALGREEMRQEQAERHHFCSEDIWDALDTFQNKLERYLERRS